MQQSTHDPSSKFAELGYASSESRGQADTDANHLVSHGIPVAFETVLFAFLDQSLSPFLLSLLQAVLRIPFKGS